MKSGSKVCSNHLTTYSESSILCGMKVKTSITLSDELIEAIEEYGQPYKNRSDFIEAAIRAFIKQIIREQENVRDIEIINRNAERLNEEASDVLAYQVQL